uniref:DUF1002 domain-containing protein n=1 Tax=Eubacterium cellulosolvens TaxID=29322 RepID=UPI0004881F36|nr:DUF1002 domain-containing protein [[Eubacterium] cellulosolvens]
MMSAKRKIMTAAALAAVMTVSAPLNVYADIAPGTTYVALGADLTEEQKTQVLGLLEVSEEELAQDKVVTITNAEEHQYLDSYIDYDTIGTTAISSTKVIAQKSGYGIHVTTKNVGYCSVEMYQNALATSGVKDADVIVAGPIPVSGTAGLLGAMKAYTEMSGEELKAENVDAATDELVTTSKLGQNIGDPLKASELIAAAKTKVAEAAKENNGELSDEQIDKIVVELAAKLEITLSDEDKQRIIELLKKIPNLDIDISDLKSQAAGIYEKLTKQGIDFGITKEKAVGLFGRIAEWFRSVGSWFADLFD